MTATFSPEDPNDDAQTAQANAKERSLADVPLPQTLGGVFDEAFDLYKRNFSGFALAVALLYLPIHIIFQSVVYFWMQPLILRLSAAKGEDAAIPTLEIMFGGLLIALVYGAALAIATGPIAVAVANAHLGIPFAVRDVYKRARPMFFRLIGGWAIAFLASAAISMIVMTACMFLVGLLTLAFANLPDILAVVVVVLLILVPYAAVCALLARNFIFTTQIIVLEGVPVSQVPQRNTRLVGSKLFRRTMGAVFFLPIVIFGLQFIVVGSAQQALNLLKLNPILSFLANTAVSSFLSFLFVPYAMIFITLLYYDYRVRREGFDVRLLSDSMPMPDIDPARPPAYMAPPTPQYGVINPQYPPPSIYPNAPQYGYSPPPAYGFPPRTPPVVPPLPTMPETPPPPAAPPTFAGDDDQ